MPLWRDEPAARTRWPDPRAAQTNSVGHDRNARATRHKHHVWAMHISLLMSAELTRSMAVYGILVHFRQNLMKMPMLKHTNINSTASLGGMWPSPASVGASAAIAAGCLSVCCGYSKDTKGLIVTRPELKDAPTSDPKSISEISVYVLDTLAAVLRST